MSIVAETMSYVDYSQAKIEDDANWSCKRSPTFPAILHVVLECAERDGQSDLVSWQPHGRAFRVLNTEALIEKVLKV